MLRDAPPVSGSRASQLGRAVPAPLAAKAFAVLTFAAVTFAAGGGWAAEGDEWDGGFDIRGERRADVALGVSSGFVLGNASGTPNDVEKIGLERYTSSTDVASGGALEVWVGGALRDWFTFAIGYGAAALGGNELVASGSYIGLHIDAFPAYALGGGYRDLGLSAMVGLGMLTGVTAEDEETVIEGGAMGALGLGVFWEGLRFARHFGAGPLLEVRHLYSQPAQWDSVTLGFRLSFYTGPRRRPATHPAVAALGVARSGRF